MEGTGIFRISRVFPIIISLLLPAIGYFAQGCNLSNKNEETKNRVEVGKNIQSVERNNAEAPVNSFNGEDFFQNRIEPLFVGSCSQCHAAPRFQVPLQGPLSIFQYQSMRLMLVDGSSDSRNALIEKINGIEHGGGDQCQGEDMQEICNLVKEWYRRETGNTAPSQILGEVSSVSLSGTLAGWAVDQSDPTRMVEFNVYINGPKETGTLLGKYPANQEGFDGGYQGSHAFGIPLGDLYRDQQQHQVYVYGIQADGQEVIVRNSPLDFIAYLPSLEGRAFFEQNLVGPLQACNGCHSGANSYNIRWGSLFSQAPHLGGTAVNNSMILKTAGNDHGGGSFCQNINQGLCATLQEWWQIEFGANF